MAEVVDSKQLRKTYESDADKCYGGKHFRKVMWEGVCEHVCVCVCVAGGRRALSFFFFFLFCFLGPTHGMWRFPVQRSNRNYSCLPSYTATAMPDPSHVCNLYHSPWQCWILNPLSKTRDRIRNLMVPSWIHFRCTTTRIPALSFSIRWLEVVTHEEWPEVTGNVHEYLGEQQVQKPRSRGAPGKFKEPQGVIVPGVEEVWEEE